MISDKLKIYHKPKLKNARLLLGFYGWMDGGDVSTGTVKYLIEQFGAERFATIKPEGFYIYSLPGSMEMSSLFRPHAIIENGMVQKYRIPRNTFYCDEENDLVLFIGKEPNLAWEQYCECIFSLCERFDVREIYFVGSVAGLTPHSRKPRIHCSVSNEKLKGALRQAGLKFVNYEGPSSIITYMTVQAAKKDFNMTSLVAEIPAYVQGYNPRCIEETIKCMAGLLGLHVPLDELRTAGDDFEKKLTKVIEKQPELAESIQKLEADYDNEVFDTEMGDLKNWLEQQGIEVD